MIKATDILKKRVVTRSGQDLGPVLNIHVGAVGKNKEELNLVCLVCGFKGFLERLGLRETKEIRVPWSAVIKVGSEKIEVKEMFEG